MSDDNPSPKEFFSWFSAQNEHWRRRPWLVLGKGPSFTLLNEMDVSGFNTFGLNHVLLEKRVDIAHVIDIDVVERCAEDLPNQAGVLLMPWYPHVRNKPSSRTLLEWIDKMPVLGVMASQGRLLWYNKHGSRQRSDSPAIRIINFSAEAPYAILGKAGVRTIRSLGIDGGAAYASAFAGLPTLLANGRDTFNSQFDEIARSICTYGIDASPLNAPGPARVYVAAAAEQGLAVKVLEYSIRKHASMSVEVMSLHEAHIPVPKPRDPRNQSRTPFSFQRFLIPELAAYAGRAIYLDSDMQVMSDIRELWSCDMRENGLLSVAPAQESGRLPQYSVMVLDCSRLDWRIDEIVRGLDDGRYTYEELMQRMVVAPEQEASIDPEWNSLERYVPGRTKLVHYTDMDTQPWVHALHPFGRVWVDELIEAVASGFISIEEIREHTTNGWIRPSLAYQVEHGIADAMLLPERILELDRQFRAPFRALGSHAGQRRLAGRVKALMGRQLALAISFVVKAKRRLVDIGRGSD